MTTGVTGVEEFTLAVLGRVAPGEVQAFAPGISDHVSAARRRLRGRRSHRRPGPNESGWEDLVDVMSPVVIYVCVAMCDAVLAGLTSELTAGTERTRARLGRRIRDRFGRGAEPAPTTTPAPAAGASATAQEPSGQRSVLRARALALALEQGLAQEQAERLADAIADGLTPRDELSPGGEE
ncbi:hypothetical protein ABZ490_13590 [Streptomyces sp. NPDC005811]|uniref:hypothetical protein n=1 Tax=Streptomyces sp. NPDC005811 TaxID=3154565 RepID=UPI00340C1983